MRALPDDVAAAIHAVADQLHVRVDDARLVREHSNTAVALPTARLLVRIAGNPDALDRIKKSVEVTRWLAAEGFRCTEPADMEPFSVKGHVVSVWRLLETASEPPGTGRELGRLLRDLHDRPNPPMELPRLIDPLASIASAVDGHPNAMTDQDRSWLLTRIDELRAAWAGLVTTLEPGLIHGDAHSNNLIRVRGGDVVLGDWDHVAHGPREWDLIQPHYMRRRFDRHSSAELREFTDAYAWDVSGWAGFETLIQVREITGLSPYVRKAADQGWARREVAHRLLTLRRGDPRAPWNTPRSLRMK
ncbi:phosphotransferase [Actinomadura sp. LD22]|uniref:Phosphotransferase n=1 Tax=Actinomadura physcomitrii TaxID=2650748 RepID=A0A6I4MCU3_9ACTN|nr:aminoglycoside phosphotransferase family protein [Actinomadura physcomitrii]MWA02760.1 phosphotransferase [Actinomadura physcomitrii]